MGAKDTDGECPNSHILHANLVTSHPGETVLPTIIANVSIYQSIPHVTSFGDFFVFSMTSVTSEFCTTAEDEFVDLRVTIDDFAFRELTLLSAYSNLHPNSPHPVNIAIFQCEQLTPRLLALVCYLSTKYSVDIFSFSIL